ncbi:winged helix DNA-binding domain-containing protein [Rhodococcus pyridinivorans]|uniref:winged helix DNA-binding domain-containing protein n=1 Tax=Rhodococcus pyridinivorans TaxID=103816 RepID=UPI0039B60FA6
MTVPVLTDRALGRATLARQHLLRRSSTDALSMIEHLLGLQAQAPLAPYFALWTRIRNFRPDALSDLLEPRAVVRIALMRGTMFAVSSADAHALRPWVQPVLDRGVDANKAHRIGLEGLDRSVLVSVARDLLAGTPMSQAELRPLLAERFLDQDPAALAHAVRCLQTWCGLTRLAEIVDRLRPQLVVFRDERGAELFDLPDAPRPDPSAAAPVRILAPFDNVLLSHADRTRFVSEEHRKRIMAENGIIAPLLLVGGTVAGSARVITDPTTAAVEMTLWRTVTASARSALEAEGMRLLNFAAPEVDTHDVRFVDAR